MPFVPRSATLDSNFDIEAIARISREVPCSAVEEIPSSAPPSPPVPADENTRDGSCGMAPAHATSRKERDRADTIKSKIIR
jgi:hypothetical protein